MFPLILKARHLVAEEQVLGSIFDVIINCCCVRTFSSNEAREERQSYALDARMLNKHSHRIEYVFYDLK